MYNPYKADATASIIFAVIIIVAALVILAVRIIGTVICCKQVAKGVRLRRPYRIAAAVAVTVVLCLPVAIGQIVYALASMHWEAEKPKAAQEADAYVANSAEESAATAQTPPPPPPPRKETFEEFKARREAERAAAESGSRDT